MARMSGVPFLGIADNGLMTRHDIVVVHTIVGYQRGGNAAHWTTGAPGKKVQARDTIYRSAANLNGNWHCLAIENEDHGPDYNWVNGVPPFTPEQCEAIAEILAWCHRVHDIPLVLVPDSKVGRRGIAYHRQGIDGNFTGPYRGRVAGGELWSSAFGKVCPGDPRIRQLNTIIIPRARVLAGLEDDDMKYTDAWDDDDLNALGPTKLGWALKNMKDNIKATRTMVDSVEPRLTSIESRLDAILSRLSQ